MALTDDQKLAWARAALTVLVLAGVVAIGWAAWTVTRSSTESAQAASGTDGQTESQADPPVHDEDGHAMSQQEWDDHAALHEAGDEHHHLTPSPVVDPPSTAVRAATPSPIATATASPAATPTQPDQERQVGRLLPGWDELDAFAPRPWGPEITRGPGQVTFSVSVLISDGSRETFGIADSFRGISGMRGGDTESYQVPAGEFIIEQQMVSGWPAPVITCDGAEPAIDGGVAVLDLQAGTTVACTFLNVRDSDSLSVVESDFSCAGFTGEVRGPQAPFWVTYVANGPGWQTGSYTLLDIGTIRVDEPGRFITPPGFLDRAGLDDGDYPIRVVVNDNSGARIPRLEALTISVGAC